MKFAGKKAYISKNKIEKIKKFNNKEEVEIDEDGGGYYSYDEFDKSEMLQNSYGKMEEIMSSKPIEPRSAKMQRKKGVIKQEMDTNVVSINFGILKEHAVLATGDPIVCQGCQAIFNMHSKITQKEEDQIWACEFCNFQNEVMVDEEEIPKTSAVNFIIESAMKAKAEKLGKIENEDISIVFCIDTSGSMCVSKPIAGKVQLKGDKRKELKDLMRFSDGSYQFLEGESKDVTYVSRLQCVQAAIEQQLIQMESSAPARKVGLVTFSDEVNIIGDGTHANKIIAGDKLFNYDFLLESSVKDADSYMKNGVKATKDTLINKVMKLEEGGPTALGPALLTSIGMASQGNPGSKVIICTDGLANIGLGNLDNVAKNEESRLFYENMAKYAKEHGVCVSIVSIAGEECNIETLSTIAELTGGDIQRVDPENLTENFANILTNEVIATHVVTRVQLHKGLRFRNEAESSLFNDHSVLVRELGNVAEDSEMTFEYSMKTPDELAKLPGFDITKFTHLSFQTQITYNTLDGMKCVRVTTEQLEISDDKEACIKNADIDILRVNAMQKASKYAKGGDFESSNCQIVGWGKAIRSAALKSSNIESIEAHKNYSESVGEIYNKVQYQIASEKMHNLNYDNCDEADEYLEDDEREMVDTMEESKETKKTGFFGGFSLFKKKTESKEKSSLVKASPKFYKPASPFVPEVSPLTIQRLQNAGDDLNTMFHKMSRTNNRDISKK